MQASLDAFDQNMMRVKALHALYDAFAKQTTSALDLSDLLRAEIVLCVSALDHFVHDLTRRGMLECWEKLRPSTEAFDRFQLPISVAGALAGAGSAASMVENEIRNKHSFLAFQHPDRIADAIRLFSPEPLWERVGSYLGISAKDAKRDLLLIVDRRNKIAHEADIDPSYPGQRWPIDAALVVASFARVDATARAIFKAVA